ncbi:decaprenyl-phosphate phosphoribosyltransferase [Geomonas oryzisoli]|uniref:Decaprenyl-phosphate phosphoribosyltransferase n=1 Tax=Geomonas oryzisoli TaxID=2847992 RepID=A0ABX8JAN3_9BACT|nr:decaprenyl-phosphate phosphoribosyltransferase [Geomonas oryzisoli]QWV95061.1 decaprenyl-phosphate phosphoribosyltransferase [Geomonas oryzisoli]
MTGYLKLMRPHQWLKNLMIFFPALLSGVIIQPGVAQRGVLPMLAFCLGSSATYVINDLLDAPKDRNHPRKSRRPIASGTVGTRPALFLALLLAVCSIGTALLVPGIFPLLLVSYLAISACYSLKLKDVAIVDIFCIAAGFVLRLEAGGDALGVAISEWLFLSVFLLSVFLSTGKRLCEQRGLGEGAGSHRKSLEGYPPGFLDIAMAMTGAAVLVTYTMYSLSKPHLIYTVPLCTFGLFRYALRVKAGGGGDPTDALLKDFPLFATGLLWLIMVASGIYR